MERRRFRSFRFRAAIQICPLLLAGCSILPGLPAGLSRKNVRAKVEPSEIVADDQSRCTVDYERFEEIEVGDGVWCLWRPEGPAVGSGSQTSSPRP